jgi:hypothetical protein
MATKVVAAVNAKLVANVDNLLYLPKGVHWHLAICSSNIRLPKHQKFVMLLIGQARGMEFSDGITQSSDTIKFDAGYRLAIYH